MGLEQDGQKGLLAINKGNVTDTVSGTFAGWAGVLLEGVGPEPGFVPPRAVQVSPSGALAMGPYGVAVLWEQASAKRGTVVSTV